MRIPQSKDQRLIAGIAAGIARALGIDPVYVRAAFITLSFCGLIGVVLYLALWLIALERGEEPEPVPKPSARRIVAVGAIFLGALFALKGIGLWFGDAVVWPVMAVSFGIAAIWDRSEEEKRREWTRFAFTVQEGEPTRVRMIIGSAVLLGGVAAFFLSTNTFQNAGPILLLLLIVSVGAVLVFGPWLWRLGQDLTVERRERIRSEERAEMAAHLHDSVLQTLAMIQRSEDQREMVTLARGQERELRSWLYAKPSQEGDELLSEALQASASDIESRHHLPIEVVTVGESQMSDRTFALLRAASEAMTNAAEHSEAESISAYMEATNGRVEIWVSDQGKGFDQSSVPDDRLGITDSIVARMRRHGGEVEINSEPGDGTEVHLVMPEPGP